MASLPNWADQLSAWSTFGGVVFVVISLYIAVSTLKSQKESNDIHIVLSIWERLDHHWARFKKTTDCSEQQSFEFGQLISYYEISCSLFRDGILTTKASRTLGEHLRDILPDLQKNDTFARLFTDIQSHDDNYSNIRWFVALDQVVKIPRPIWSIRLPIGSKFLRVSLTPKRETPPA